VIIIEPHIHMYSRTTDDYGRMYASGIRACVEPSFWLGTNRRYAGTFFDYFRLILDFETVRARRFGIDHYAAVSVNPKEAEDVALAEEVMAGMGDYLDHPRCVAVGEIGLNNITANEETVFRAQLEIAVGRQMPIIIHLPHFEKPKGAYLIRAILEEMDVPRERTLIDHNTEETMPILRDFGTYLGLTTSAPTSASPSTPSRSSPRSGCRTSFASSAPSGSS